jgi:hypothetical protein
VCPIENQQMRKILDAVKDSRKTRVDDDFGYALGRAWGAATLALSIQIAGVGYQTRFFDAIPDNAHWLKHHIIHLFSSHSEGTSSAKV